MHIDKCKMEITTASAPAAIGPYSQAVHSGNLIYTSGQVGLDPATGNIVEGGIEAQTTQVLENLKHVLRAGGIGMENVVKTTVFLKDLKDFAAMNTIYAKFLAP